jgi:RNA polymerase sigma-70 factor (ECF subfamily)
MDLSDEQLLRSMASGNRAAFAAFYDRHAPRVLSLLGKWLGRHEDAEDVLQETFWQVWSRAGEYDATRAAAVAWLLVIARSRAKDRLRLQRSGTALPLGPPGDGMKDPPSILGCKELAQRLREALGSLPEEQRTAITLAFYGGLTYEQVARAQAVPTGTAKTRIRLGMRRLRHLLGD